MCIDFIYSQVIDKEVPATERGDALIFLNGVSEITTVAETLKTYAELHKNWIILMLHRWAVLFYQSLEYGLELILF